MKRSISAAFDQPSSCRRPARPPTPSPIEAANLEVGAVDSANMLLRVTGKGNKQRLVPLPRPLLNDLRDLWRTHRHPRWLFLNRVRRHLLFDAGGGACVSEGKAQSWRIRWSGAVSS